MVWMAPPGTLPGSGCPDARSRTASGSGKQKDEDLLRSILEGKGAMPSFKHKLGREEALGLLTEIIRPLARRARNDPGSGPGAKKSGE